MESFQTFNVKLKIVICIFRHLFIYASHHVAPKTQFIVTHLVFILVWRRQLLHQQMIQTNTTGMMHVCRNFNCSLGHNDDYLLINNFVSPIDNLYARFFSHHLTIFNLKVVTLSCKCFVKISKTATKTKIRFVISFH